MEGLIYEYKDGVRSLKWFLPSHLSKAAFNEDECIYYF